MPMPEQASMPWMTMVFSICSALLAKAGNAASITCEIAQKVARPIIDSQMVAFSPSTWRLRRRYCSFT